jgi:hypothetical protein
VPNHTNGKISPISGLIPSFTNNTATRVGGNQSHAHIGTSYSRAQSCSGKSFFSMRYQLGKPGIRGGYHSCTHHSDGSGCHVARTRAGSRYGFPSAENRKANSRSSLSVLCFPKVPVPCEHAFSGRLLSATPEQPDAQPASATVWIPPRSAIVVMEQ